MQNPNAKGNSGFLWGVGVLLVIIAVVIAYIVFTQKDAKSDKIAESAVDVTLTVSRGDDGVVTLKGENAKADVPEVDLYEDFSCPHCAELAEGSDEPMKQAVEKGELIVNVHPLNFLDLRGQDLDAYLADKSIKLDGHSSTSVSALDILAEAGDAQAYWNLRAYLFENQQTISTWDFEQFAEAAKGFGASDDSVKAISKATVDAGNDIGRANAKKLKEETGSVSSPRVIQDGKDLEKPEDVPVNEWNWVEQVL
ncbi:thioredoxin domain-containing protein [Corynebacterium sp.]|uniref:DsbA family protein n=1 Tax=Corynebacterium sp. TaxID=1720 RepID=UPI0026DD8076|nr:thioredoxin domain-containing protein [Corynebacterium sp.]MDO5033003.1 thioredoxin domain-containing protein [Corynebacterium sp.]